MAVDVQLGSNACQFVNYACSSYIFSLLEVAALGGSVAVVVVIGIFVPYSINLIELVCTDVTL